MKKVENDKSQLEKKLQEATEVRTAETAQAKAYLDKQIEDMKKLHDKDNVWVNILKLHAMLIMIKEKINIL